MNLRYTEQDMKEALDLFGLSAMDEATQDSIDKTYKLLIKKWHPDICLDPQALEMTKKINKARDLLVDLLKGYADIQKVKSQRRHTVTHTTINGVDYTFTGTTTYFY